MEGNYGYSHTINGNESIKAQTAVGIAVMKKVMSTDKENATQMTEMIKSIAVDPNLGNHIDVSA